jgi:tRNA 2-thiouridine synthesizing protein B
MAMLHTVNKSPSERNTLDSCLSHAKDGSLKEASGISLYALGPDLKARGIGDDQLVEGVTVVDYDGFVDLVTRHENVQSWL